jgi:hypothetical protein
MPKMTVEVAQQLLARPQYVIEFLDEAIATLAAATLDGDVTPEELLRRRGIRDGLKMAAGFFHEARSVLRAAADEAADQDAARTTDMVPPGLLDALVYPRTKES